MAKKIIFIHGRAVKPLEEDLQELWYNAIRHGIDRDFGQTELDAFEQVNKEFVYYGDLSNTFLHEEKGEKIPDETKSRIASLNELKKFRKEDFNKETYEDISKYGFLKEALADTFSGVLSLIRAGTPLISSVAPDMAHYWNQEAYFGSDVRFRLTKVLKEAFDNNDQIMLVSHSLGAIVSYDNLWKFSHYSEYRGDYGKNKKIDLFVTMGSPLGDENVKQHLKGKSSKGALKYPHNIRQWVNLSAEDDYICHDGKIANDFIKMKEYKLIGKSIKDIHPIYNLTVRNKKSNPHSAIGYLIHPEFTSLLTDWMKS